MVDRLLIKNIKTLYTSMLRPPVKGKDMGEIEKIDNAYIEIEDGFITMVGQGHPGNEAFFDHVYDAEGTIALPGLVDSHTHLVFGGSREDEFRLKLQGVPYLDILKQGGGILNTVKKTKEASHEELYLQARKSLDEMLLFGVTTLEAKSGYGLDLDTEIKQLEVMKRLDNDQPIDIHSTYLGAHALPTEYKEKRDEYIEKIIHDQEIIAKNNLAEYADVFCETGVFTAQETRRILMKAKQVGLGLRVHTDEIDSIGGTEVAIELGAKTVDHLMATTEKDMKALAMTNIIGNLLPATSFFLNKDFAPARKMIDSGMAISISSDYNPGSTPSENFQLTMQLAGNKLRMTPEEILTASTINPAYSLGLSDHIGSLEVGKRADILLLDVKNLDYFIYHYGINHTRAVFKNGILVVDNRMLVR